jgi:multiple sugar transport system substrate-binding protein
MVIVPKLHAELIRGPILDQVKPFQQRTGAKVRVVTPGWNDTIQKIDQSLTDPNLNYDIFVVIALWNGTLLGGNHIEPVPQWVKDKIDWDDVLPIYRDNILSWGGVAYGLPYDGDSVNLYYRKDIFEDPEYQRRFRLRYGYKLKAPKTWKQYRDIAEFFTGWDWDKDGKIEYGITGARVRGDVTLLQFFARAAAYAKHPDQKAYYFDPDTMQARINNPGFVRALTEWVEVMRFGPPGMANFAGHDVRNNFASGEVAMAMDWADLGIFAANSPVSIVQDKVGYAQIPGSNRVFNPVTERWEKRYNQVSSISGNWMFFVNKNSKNKQLAFEFAAHMTSPELTSELTATSGNAVNPSRYSHFTDPTSWQKGGFSIESAERYLKEITISLANTNVVWDITIPGAAEYYQALDKLIHKAVLGKLQPQEALDLAAARWEEITDRLGREKQIQTYRASLNLPAK